MVKVCWEAFQRPELYALHPKLATMAPSAAGKMVTPTEPDHPHIHTPEFKNWFGDWAKPQGTTPSLFSRVVHKLTGKPLPMVGKSKVVENGKPKVVYHGSPSVGFNEFRPSPRDVGHHFGTMDQAAVLQGGGEIRKFFLNIRNPLRMKDVFGDTSTVVNELLKSHGIDATKEHNIFKVKAEEARKGWSSNGPDAETHRNAWHTAHAELLRAIEKKIQSHGYDGIEYQNTDEAPGTSYAVFHPHQIKSATGNRGTYDPADPSINYAICFEAFLRPELYQMPLALPTQHEFGGLMDRATAAPTQGINKTLIIPHGNGKLVAKASDSNPHEVANEIAASKIRRLLGDATAPEVAHRQHNGRNFLVMPHLPGENWSDVERQHKAMYPTDANRVFRETNREYTKMAQSVPKERLGQVAFQNWFMNATDRHANNHLLEHGSVHPIDYGFAFGPWNHDSSKYWFDRPDGLLSSAGHTSSEAVANLPVSREILESALDNRRKIEDAIREHVLPRHTDPRFPANVVWDSHQGKFSQIADALKRTGDATMRNFGNLYAGFYPHRPGATGEGFTQKPPVDPDAKTKIERYEVTLPLKIEIRHDDEVMGTLTIDAAGKVIAWHANQKSDEEYFKRLAEIPNAGKSFEPLAKRNRGLNAKLLSGHWPV